MIFVAVFVVAYLVLLGWVSGTLYEIEQRIHPSPRLVGGLILAGVLALGVARVTLNDGIWDALCAVMTPEERVLFGCTSQGDPHGS